VSTLPSAPDSKLFESTPAAGVRGDSPDRAKAGSASPERTESALATLHGPPRAALASSAPEPAELELFRLAIGQQGVAVEVGLIHEVVRTPPVAPLPGAPPFLIGVAAHRGDVVAVVDLARLLGRGQTRLSGRSRLAIARSDGMVVGILADEVTGLVRFPAGALHSAPLGAEGAEFISGVVEEGQGLQLLDLRRALSAARARATART
jgi:purine-binding chemotaxis protein CheW